MAVTITLNGIFERIMNGFFEIEFLIWQQALSLVLESILIYIEQKQCTMSQIKEQKTSMSAME